MTDADKDMMLACFNAAKESVNRAMLLTIEVAAVHPAASYVSKHLEEVNDSICFAEAVLRKQQRKARRTK